MKKIELSKVKYLGQSTDIKRVAEIYDIATKEYFGEFAKPNKQSGFINTISLIIIGVILTSILGTGYLLKSNSGIGVPVLSTYYKTILPLTDSTYEVGTSTQAFLRGNFDELCLTADSCQTTWPGAAGGEANTASSLGTGRNIFDSKSGVDLRFNTLSAGSNITLSTSTQANTIEISSTGGSGEFSWTKQTWGNSTSTALGFLNGFLSTASSTFSNILRGREAIFSSYIDASHFVATSTTATSTFAGALGVGTSTPAYSQYHPGLVLGLNKNIILTSDRTTNNFLGNIIFKNEAASTTKTGLEWYGFDATTSDAWIVYHQSLSGELDGSHGAPHIEIETSDLSGAKQGRFNIEAQCDYDCIVNTNQAEFQINRNSGQTNGNLLFNGGGQIRNTGVMQIIPWNAINTKGFRISTSTDNDVMIDVTSGTELEIQDTINLTGSQYISGSLGIGTTSPANQLTIEKSGASGTIIGSTIELRQNQTAINSTTNSTLGEILFSGADILAGETGVGAKIRAQASNAWNGTTNDYPTDLLFFTMPNGGSGGLAERMRLTDAGNLGIGTTTPGTLLSLGNTGNDTINISPTATSTFGTGINLRGGCFAIDGTCVGGAGGGSGTVTSVGLSSSGSLTIGNTPVTTSGTITADLNLASSNTWTGGQIFGNATSTNATTTNLYVSGNASTTNLFTSSLKFKGVTGFLKATAGIVANALIDLASDITGILPVANGGTGISSLGTGIATWLGTPSSSNLVSAVTDETGSGLLVFGTNPTFSSKITVVASTTFNGVELLFPSSAGTNGQFLTTNGLGGLSWTTSSGSGDITDVWDCASGNCSSIIGSAGDSLDAGSADSLEIPNTANPTVNVAGQIALNTTAASSSLRFYSGSTEFSLYPEKDSSSIYASSTLAYDGAYGASATTTYKLANYKRPVTLTNLYCITDTGTVYAEIGTGVASSTVQCTSTGAVTNVATSFISRQTYMISIGKQTGDPNLITITDTLRSDAD